MKLVPRLAAFRQIGVSVLVVLVTLAIIDLLLTGFGLFPPAYRYGNPVVGWSTNGPRTPPFDWCLLMADQTRVDYYRNELGIRTQLTADEIRAAKDRLLIAAVGDSQSDLCAENKDTHQGVLEDELNRMGLETTVLSNGVGRYSPLQAYLLFKYRLRDFDPQALVLNVYTGNDFIDMLRVDDRPHFVPGPEGYTIAPPVWYRLYDPDVKRYSRVMFVYRSLLERIGLRNLYLRLRFLLDVAGQDGQGLKTVFRYINDLRKSNEPSVGYSGAFAAQIFNQQLFFHHFPESESEALRRMGALMRLIRAENPDLMLFLSPIPSYQVAGEEPVDEAFLRTLSRLPLEYAAGIEAEERLYYALRELAVEEGWIFVDNLQPLREYRGPQRLFNDFDYHLLPAASHIIGENQARVFWEALDGAQTVTPAAAGGRERAGRTH